MKQSIVTILLFMLLSSCELIVIGDKNPRKEIVIYSQTSSIGAVHLFKKELDNDNVPAASIILANPMGRRFLPLEQFQMYYDIDRIRRSFDQKQITNIETDTLSNISFSHDVELEYVYHLSIITQQIDSSWYIIKFDDYLDIPDTNIEP